MMFQALSEDEWAELRLMRMANELGKFVVSMSDIAGGEVLLQRALERLQVDRRVTLIDVCPIAAHDGVFRVFMLSVEGNEYRRGLEERYQIMQDVHRRKETMQ